MKRIKQISFFLCFLLLPAQAQALLGVSIDVGARAGFGGIEVEGLKKQDSTNFTLYGNVHLSLLGLFGFGGFADYHSISQRGDRADNAGLDYSGTASHIGPSIRFGGPFLFLLGGYYISGKFKQKDLLATGIKSRLERPKGFFVSGGISIFPMITADLTFSNIEYRTSVVEEQRSNIEKNPVKVNSIQAGLSMHF